MKIKDKESSKRNDALLVGENNSNDSKFLIRNHGGQKEVAHISRVLKEKNCQFRVLSPVTIFFRKEREIKMSDEGNKKDLSPAERGCPLSPLLFNIVLE